MKALFRLTLNALRPAEAEAEKLLAGYPNGVLLSVEVRKPRSLPQHRRFFAILQLVVENSERWADVDDLRTDIAIDVGWVEKRVVRGVVYHVPKSISHSNMDQDEFQKFHDSAMIIIESVIPGVTWDEWAREASERCAV